jgi:hypothetical protein
MHRLGRFVLSLFDHPKLLDPATGRIDREWPEVSTGRQDGGLISQDQELPAIAIDEAGMRFAVAEGSDAVMIDIADLA